MPDLREFVNFLEADIDLIQYSAHLGIELNKHSLARCVAHDDKNPSMIVNHDHVYCFACGFYSKATNLTMISKGTDFKESLNILCDYKGVPRFVFGKKSQQEIDAYKKQKDRENQVYKLLNETVKLYQTNENIYLTDKRKISKEIIKELQIGATNGNKYFLKEELLKKSFKPEEFAPLLLNKHGQDFFQHCVIIPIFKSGRIIGVYGRKYDNSPDFKHLYLKNEGFKTLGIEPETTLYNFDNAKKFKEIFMFESIIDCLSAISNGIENSVAIYGTQGLKEEHLKQLKTSRIQKVFMVMDGDEAGKKAATKQGYKIEDIGISVKAIMLPEGQDSNEYFLKGGTKKSFLRLSLFTPIELAIKEKDPDLTGRDFVDTISPILDRIATQDHLTWNYGLKAIKEHFHSENPSINDLKSSLKQLIDQQEFEKKREEKSLIPIPSNTQDSTSLSEIFNEQDISHLMIPPDFLITEKGISSIITRGDECFEVPIAHAPCIIKSMSSNIEIGTEFRKLLFKQDKKIKSLNVPREIICDQKKIIELSAHDFPVNSLNAKYLVKYLADFEALNRSKLSQQSITHGFGHRYDSKGKLIYYLPQKAYGTDESLSFEGKGPGDGDYLKALTPRGKLTDWIQIIKEYCLPFKFVMFNLYAGFSVPLLRIFNIHKSFIINYSRKSSTGKTTNNEVVASIYGNPAKLILQWQFITHVGVEQLAGLFNGIPIFLDDSQNADEKKVSEIIYIITHGIGKTRGYKTGGLQKVPDWLTELFSTSEENIQKDSKKEGSEARTWDFNVLPFGSEDDKETGEIVRTIKKLVYETYGVAIYPFLDYIYRLDHKKIMCYYNEAYRNFNIKAAKGGKAHRQVEYWAAVLAAGLIAEEVFHFGSEPLWICNEVFDLYQQEGFSDPITESMEDFISWANSNDDRYEISGASYDNQERSYGPRHGVKNPGEYVAVFPHLLKDFLVKEGYSYKTVLKGWKERGWIYSGKESFAAIVSFRGKNTRMIKINWKTYTQE